MNAVERLYEAMPAFLYFNASILSGLLEPLLLSQDLLSGQPYCLQDIGGYSFSPLSICIQSASIDDAFDR